MTPSPVGPPEGQREIRREGRQFEGFPPSTKQVYTDVTRAVLSPAGVVRDFDPNIHVDNTKESGGGGGANNSSGSSNNNSVGGSPMRTQPPAPKTSSSEVGGPPLPDAGGAQQQSRAMHLRVATQALLRQNDEEDLSSSPVRLSACALLSHLVNHLFHFPLPGPAGAASLASMVSEHDDLHATSEAAGADAEMTMEVFSAPNVQFFLINSSTLLSFVELPSLDVPGKIYFPGRGLDRLLQAFSTLSLLIF